MRLIPIRPETLPAEVQEALATIQVVVARIPDLRGSRSPSIAWTPNNCPPYSGWRLSVEPTTVALEFNLRAYQKAFDRAAEAVRRLSAAMDDPAFRLKIRRYQRHQDKIRYVPRKVKQARPQGCSQNLAFRRAWAAGGRAPGAVSWSVPTRRRSGS